MSVRKCSCCIYVQSFTFSFIFIILKCDVQKQLGYRTKQLRFILPCQIDMGNLSIDM